MSFQLTTVVVVTVVLDRLPIALAAAAALFARTPGRRQAALRLLRVLRLRPAAVGSRVRGDG